MAGKEDERLIGDPLIIGWDVWDFYRDVSSDCFVARKRGDEDRPVVCARYEELRKRIKGIYEE